MSESCGSVTPSTLNGSFDSSPIGYFSSLLRKVKGRLSSVHGFGKSPVPSPAVSYATLPRNGDLTCRSGRSRMPVIPLQQAIVIERPLPLNNSQNNPNPALTIDIYGNQLAVINQGDSVFSLKSAQLFGTLPRRTNHTDKNTPTKSAIPVVKRKKLTAATAHSSFASYLLSRSSSTTTADDLFYRPARFYENQQQSPKTIITRRNSSCASPSNKCHAGTSSSVLPGPFFWEESDITKQCRSLFKDCRRALDGVLFSLERYFDAFEISPSPPPSSSSSSSPLSSPSQLVRSRVVTDNGSSVNTSECGISTTPIDAGEQLLLFNRRQEQRQLHYRLLSSINSAVSQLFLILVELRNVLTQLHSSSSAQSENSLEHNKPDCITTATLLPVGVFLSQLAGLCDLLAISGSLSSSDSGISMKSATAKMPMSSPQKVAIPVAFTSYRNATGNTSTNSNANSRNRPSKQQTVQVVHNLRDTLNRIDEGLPVIPVFAKQTSSSTNNTPSKNAQWKTTLLVNSSDEGSGTANKSNGSNSNQRSSVRMMLAGGSDRRGQKTLASLEHALKTVSFDEPSDSSPDRTPRSGRTTTGLYDNVECYSPGPDYLNKNKIHIADQRNVNGQTSCSSELFVTVNQDSAVAKNNDNKKSVVEIPVIRSSAPSKPIASAKLGATDGEARSVPVWVCRKPDIGESTPHAASDTHSPPITPFSITQVCSVNSKRSCSQPPQTAASGHHMVQQTPHRMPQPLGQGSCQDILLMDHVDSLLEFGDKGAVRSGCTDALIVYASLPSSTEAHRIFVDAFLTTYCTFLMPEQLVDKLIYRFEKLSHGISGCFGANGTTTASSNSSKNVQLTPADENRQKLSCSTLCLLVHVVSSLSSSDAFFRWPSLRSRLAEFVYSLLRRPGLWHLAVALRRELLRAEANLQTLSSTKPDELLLLSPVSHSQSESHATNRKSMSLLDFKSRRLAEQMTLIDWRLFELLDLSELLVYATSGGGNSASGDNPSIKSGDISLSTPRLSNFTRHFNDVSLWARTIILKQETEKLRERYIMKLAKVVQHLRQLQNFNSSLALLSALDSTAIRRLASAARVSKRIKSVVNGLRDLTDSSQSFKSYRLILENCQPPAIPYLGLTLQDLTFVHIGSPDVMPEDAVGGSIINFAKRLQQHRILESVRRFKASHAVYNFTPDSDMLVYFDNFADHWDEERCWAVSEKIKPRTVHNPPPASFYQKSSQHSTNKTHVPCVTSSTAR